MRILKKKERGYRSFSEKYDLSGAYAGKYGRSLGVLLLFILSTRYDIEVVEITAEANGDIGEEHNILHINKKSNEKVFKEITFMLDLFEQKEIEVWELKGLYNGIEIAITGRTFGSVLSVRTPLTSNINMLSVLSDVEVATYDYHDYDIQLVSDMKAKFKLNQKMAILSLAELEGHLDIYKEFLRGMENNMFSFPEENAIVVEGYSAEMLFANYPLSELGAYKYLIYLREEPEAALADLKAGLPRK